MKQFSVITTVNFKRIFARVRLHYRIEVGKCVATKSQQQTQKVTLSLWFDQLVVFLGMDRDVNYSHVLGLESPVSHSPYARSGERDSGSVQVLCRPMSMSRRFRQNS